jgi:hypothetical protein
LPTLRQRPRVELEYLLELASRVTGIATQESLYSYVLLRVLAAYLPARRAGRPQRAAPS